MALKEGKNMIVKRKDEEGKIEYSRELILETIIKYYEKLYQREENGEKGS